MTANCVAEHISLLGVKYEISKENVATIIVLVDILNCFFLWIALLSAKIFSSAAKKDIDGQTLRALDFTVTIEVPQYDDEFDDLKPIIWEWARHAYGSPNKEDNIDSTIDPANYN